MTHLEWLQSQLAQNDLVHQLLLEGDDPCDDWPADEFIPDPIIYDYDGPR